MVTNIIVGVGGGGGNLGIEIHNIHYTLIHVLNIHTVRTRLYSLRNLNWRLFMCMANYTNRCN